MVDFAAEEEDDVVVPGAVPEVFAVVADVVAVSPLAAAELHHGQVDDASKSSKRTPHEELKTQGVEQDASSKSRHVS